MSYLSRVQDTIFSAHTDEDYDDRNDNNSNRDVIQFFFSSFLFWTTHTNVDKS